MTIESAGAPTAFPREPLLALLRHRAEDFASIERRAELFAGLGVDVESPALARDDFETRLDALVDYLSDPSRLDTALRLARRVASRAGSEIDAEPLVKTLEDLQLEHRARAVEAGAAPDLGTLRDWLGLECVHVYSLSDRFFGREAEVQELDTWVAEPESTVGVRCVCALGGSGKSALAWHWISRAPLRQLGYRGVFWCSFYEKNFDFPEFLRRSLEWCGQASANEVKQLTRTEMERRLLKVLKDEPFVFVLDGLERLMNGYAIVFDRAVDPDAVRAGKHEADVTALDRQLTDPRSGAFLKRLAAAMKSKVVVTTRLAPAELEESTGVEIAGAKFMTLHGLAPREVAQLWASILPAGPRIDSELEAIFALCDNHPLVVSILARSAARAGGWAEWRNDVRHDDFVPPASASAMEARAHVIGTCLRDLDDRSYDVLGALTTSGKPMALPLLARILLGSSELAGDRRWTSDAQVREELDALVSLGFVGADAGDVTEYDVHPVVRGAVWNLLTDTRGERHLRHALSEFFATPDRKDPDDGIDLNKAISLFRLLVQSQEIDRAWEMYFNKLWWPLAVVNDNRTLLDLFELLLPGGDPLQLLPLRSRREQANSSDVFGSLLMQAGAGNRDVSQRLLRWCGAIRLQIGDFQGFLDARHSRMWQTMYEGRLFDAEVELRQMRIQAAHFDAGEIRHVIECWIGLTLAMRGYKEAALRQFTLAQGQISSHRWWAQGLAEGYVYLEEPDQALAWLDEAAATPLTEGRVQEAWELVTRGMAQFQKKQWDAAEDSLVKALEHAVRSSYALVQCFAIPYIAQIFLERGDLAEAESRIESYFRLDEHSLYALAATDAWRVRALCALARGNHAAAIEFATRAYRLAACDGPPFAYEAALRRALETLAQAGAYAPQANARLVPAWREELERLDAAAAGAANGGEVEEQDEPDAKAGAPLTAPEARRRLAEFAVMRQASEHDRRWWQEVTKDTHIAIEFRLGAAIESYGITLERFREAYEASTHKSVLVTFSQLQAERIVHPQRPRPVGSLEDAEQREWLAQADQHAKSLESFMRHVEFADRMRANFEVHEFDDIGIRAFLHDARRRIGFDDAAVGRVWWTQLERTAPQLNVLVLAETIFWSGATLDEFVAAIAANADRGIEYAFHSIRVQRAIAELERPSVSRTEGWSDLQIFLRLKDVKQRIRWSDASESARQFWTAFERRNERDLPRVLRLAEELAVRNASIDEYYRAYLLSGTDHVEAGLSYLDYARLKALDWNGDVSLLDDVGRSADVRSVTTLTFSNTKEWSGDQLKARLGALEERLDWDAASEEIRHWWRSAESRYGPQVAIRLAEELEARRARISNLHLAHVDGGTDNLPAAFAYLDFTLMKAAQEEKARQRAGTHEKQGREHLEKKRYRDAARSFLEAVREAPFVSRYYVDAAASLERISDDTRGAAIAEAIEILERGIARVTTEAKDLYLTLARVWEHADGVARETAFQHAISVLERGVTAAHVRLKDLDDLRRRRTYGALADAFAHLADKQPWVVPLAIEVADNLVPFIDSKQDEGAFLHGMVPAMKDRVQAAYALRLPGLRFRGNAGLPPGGFRVLLHEVPLVDGSLSSRASYAIAADARAAGVTAGSDTLDPITDQPCVMIGAADAERLEKAGVSVWTVPQFFIRQLERIVTHHVHCFADVLAVADVLDRWSNEGHGELIDRKLPTPSDRIVFCRLFRSLLRDGLRVSPPGSFATALLEALPEPPQTREAFAETLAAMRVNLRRFLAGNQPRVERVVLPPELQDQVRQAIPKLDADAHMQLLEALRDYARPADEGRRALVVADAATRAWLQRFLDPVYPKVKVMTDAEISEDSVVLA